MNDRWMDVDDCGMPRNLTLCSDELFRRLGRVAMIGSIIELRVSDIVVQWGRDRGDTGRLMDHLARRFDALVNSRSNAGLDVPRRLVDVVSEAKAVMVDRNAAVHALRPEDDCAWLNRPDGAKDAPTLVDMDELIERMSNVVDALGPFLSTPVEFPEAELKPCACGCGATTDAKFRPGHRANVIDRRIDRLFGGDVMAFALWLDEHPPVIAPAGARQQTDGGGGRAL